jgi:hypothetical protein
MENLKNQLSEIKLHVSIAESEINLLSCGRKSSGPRVRSALMKLKTLAHSARASATTAVSELPTKSRVKKDEVVPEAEPIESDELVVKPKPKKKTKPKAVASEVESEPAE